MILLSERAPCLSSWKDALGLLSDVNCLVDIDMFPRNRKQPTDKHSSPLPRKGESVLLLPFQKGKTEERILPLSFCYGTYLPFIIFILWSNSKIQSLNKIPIGIKMFANSYFSFIEYTLHIFARFGCTLFDVMAIDDMLLSKF